MTDRLSLSLFGCIHFDRPDAVTEDLEAFAGSADAVFVERAPDSVGLAALVRATLRSPLQVLGFYLWGIVLQAPLMLAFNRDLRATEHLALERVTADRDLPVHDVDVRILEGLAADGPVGIAANWAVVGTIAWFSPVATAVTGALLAAVVVPFALRGRGHPRLAVLALVGWYAGALALGAVWLTSLSTLSVTLLLAAAVAGPVGVFGSVGERNRAMLDRAQALADEHGYERTVLVTGVRHLRGLATLAEGRGVAVPRVRLPEWRQRGTTLTDVEPSTLPGVGRRPFSGPVIAAGSEREVARDRVLAGLADGVFLSLIGLVAGLLWLVVAGEHVGPTLPASVVTVSLALLVAVPLAIATYTEWAGATSPGKAPRDLAVATVDGEAPPLRAVLLRNLCKPIDVLGVGLLCIWLTERDRRLGDLLAGTVVGRRVDASGAAEADVAEGTDPAGRPGAEGGPDANDRPGTSDQPDPTD